MNQQDRVSASALRPAALGRRRFGAGLAALLLAGQAPALRAQGAERIVLGQSAALTGPSGELGVQFRAGAMLVFDQVNAQGGVARRAIELRSLDDGYEPERCAENTRRLIADDVFALFGYIGTPTSLAELPLCTQTRVPYFAPFTGAVALRRPLHRLIFHVRASYDDETELMVRQLTHLGLNRIGVFHQDDTYGQAGLDGVTRALAARQLKPAITAKVQRNSVDVAGAVAQMRQAWPEAIVQVSTYASCAAFVRAARKAGFGGVFYNVSFVGTQALADALGADGAGVVVSQVVPSPYSPTRQITREFHEAIKRGGGAVRPNYSSLEGYIAARVLVEGLRGASAQGGGRPTREGLIAALEGVDASVGGFAVAFSGASHEGSRFVEMSLLTGDGRVRT